MENAEKIKSVVREKYGDIAKQSKTSSNTPCCESSSCSTTDNEVVGEDYSKIKGYNKDADLGLGCGLPTEHASIKEGDTVVDLGSGAGNDVFIAREIVGEKGKVIGIDMTEGMIEKARENNQKLGFNNVEFRFGEIENLPVTTEQADVIVSNCVLNLVPNKKKSFEEIFRILKAGGHFSISDIVTSGALPDSMKSAAELYAGCVSGAISKSSYLDIVKETGFEKITVQKEHVISLPDDFLKKYLSDKELEDYKESKTRILSVTVYAEKPQSKKMEEKIKDKIEEKKPGCC
jgi:ubiquinone/menaquinone biosynthesis C-methylase UbiE